MPTIEQIRAARALLDWSQSDLADHAGLSQTGIARIENGTNKPNSSTLTKIESAFDKADVEFLAERGVQKRTNEIRIFHGQDGFTEFLQDVHSVVQNTKEQTSIVVNNVSEAEFLRWEGDYANIHQERMKNANVHYQIIIAAGDQNFTASEYAEYRCVPTDVFSSVSYYIYGDRTALIDFNEDDVVVYLMNNAAIANFYREEFEKIWAKAEVPKN